MRQLILQKENTPTIVLPPNREELSQRLVVVNKYLSSYAYAKRPVKEISLLLYFVEDHTTMLYLPRSYPKHLFHRFQNRSQKAKSLHTYNFAKNILRLLLIGVYPRWRISKNIFRNFTHSFVPNISTITFVLVARLWQIERKRTDNYAN